MNAIKPILVLKVGGNEFSLAGTMESLARVIAAQQNSYACVLVHGGGRAVSDMLRKMRIEPKFVDGQRVTDAQTLEVAEMVLSGSINKDLVFELVAAGLDALGLSGVDRGLLRVVPWGKNMGRVGRIVEVRAQVLRGLCLQNIVPVISPISAGADGKYNVNADHAAAMIAGALQASEMVLLTDVSGVLIDENIVTQLHAQEIPAFIQNGTIKDGMIPKVNACVDALASGTQVARITNLDGFTSRMGTRILKDGQEKI
jgi:acetylglutamate kinase